MSAEDAARAGSEGKRENRTSTPLSTDRPNEDQQAQSPAGVNAATVSPSNAVAGGETGSGSEHAAASHDPASRSGAVSHNASGPAIISKAEKTYGRELRALQMRRGQLEYFRGVKQRRMTAIVARRQYGKTTTFSKVALYKMMKTPNHTVVFGSAKLNLSREIVRKESEVIQSAVTLLRADLEDNQLQMVATATPGSREQRVEALHPDDFADIFEAQRLEFRYYHSRDVYSRTKVIALNPSAVGETGDLMADEIGRIQNWREVWEAIEPIVSSNPEYRLTLSTTVPPDDKHLSFEQLMPPIGAEFPVNPAGNWYQSEHGIWVLRLDAFDAYADGVPVYDLTTGEPLHPSEHRKRSHDKDAWDRNYGCKFVMGGTAACGLVQLDSAMRQGLGHCAWFLIEEDGDMDRAMEFLGNHLGAGKVGLGWDLATTEKEVSNPNGFAVVEEVGNRLFVRLILSWKTKDPEIARKYTRRVITTIRQRPVGGPARRLCIDATNERYFAMDLRKALAGELPVELVIASTTVEVPGEQDPITLKQFTGGQLVAALDDNRLVLPPERFVKDDFRRVKKERGQFVTELGPNGEHGDTFDGVKNGIRALTSTAGGIETTSGIVLQTDVRRTQKTFRPRYIRRGALFIPGGSQ